MEANTPIAPVRAKIAMGKKLMKSEQVGNDPVDYRVDSHAVAEEKTYSDLESDADILYDTDDKPSEKNSAAKGAKGGKRSNKKNVFSSSVSRFGPYTTETIEKTTGSVRTRHQDAHGHTTMTANAPKADGMGSDGINGSLATCPAEKRSKSRSDSNSSDSAAEEIVGKKRGRSGSKTSTGGDGRKRSDVEDEEEEEGLKTGKRRPKTTAKATTAGKKGVKKVQKKIHTATKKEGADGNFDGGVGNTVAIEDSDDEGDDMKEELSGTMVIDDANDLARSGTVGTCYIYYMAWVGSALSRREVHTKLTRAEKLYIN